MNNLPTAKLNKDKSTLGLHLPETYFGLFPVDQTFESSVLLFSPFSIPPQVFNASTLQKNPIRWLLLLAVVVLAAVVAAVLVEASAAVAVEVSVVVAAAVLPVAVVVSVVVEVCRDGLLMSSMSMN